ncbi:MAG: AAA domain-containing protein [Cytophagales bacterium]|nr:AAA domain-containing protein [Cytophagales bacterium]
MKHILQSYLRRLTNLTANNKSLFLLRLVADRFIDLHDFNYLFKKSSFEIIDSLICKKPRIGLCSLADSRDQESNLTSKKLKRLSRVERYIFEERGSKDLYVGWPFIKGKLSDGTMIRCPLIFFPVELSLEENDWCLSIRKDVSITFNKSFLLAYSHYNEIKIPEEFIEQTLDDLEKDSTVFRTTVYKILKESNVEVNFNQETFLDQLKPFKEYTKAEYDKKKRNGVLKLHPEAVLGIFPQAGSYLVPDYQHLIEEDRYDDIEAFFASRSVEEKIDIQKHSADYFHFITQVKEEDTFTPFKLDAYQENALKAIKRGNSLVIQGPPGTGKSQLICNLISDFIARGKRVLLVCQKRAALDVVHRRLHEADFSAFTALVHDFKNDRKIIFNQINSQIERLYDYRIKNGSLDTIQLERKFLQSSRRIDQITEEFEEFKKVLFDEAEAGVSIKELYLNSDRNAEVINIKQEYREFPYDDISQFETKLKSYFAYHKKFNKEGYTWRNRKRFTGYGIEDLSKMKAILREIPLYQDEISKRVEGLLGSGMELKVAEKIYEGRENLKEMLRYLKDDSTFIKFKHIIKSRDTTPESLPDLLWLSTMRRTLMGCFDSPGPEISLNTGELGEFQEALRKKMQARKNIFANIKWYFFSKDKAWIKKVLTSNNLRRKGSDYRILEKMVDYRLNLEHNMTKIAGTKWLTAVPEFYLKDVFDKWFVEEKDAVSAYLIFDHYRNFKEYFNTSSLGREQFIEKVNELYELVIDIPNKMDQWRIYFRDARIEVILADSRLNAKMISSLDADFEALCDFDNLKSALEDSERGVIDKLLDLREYESEEEITAVFKNSLQLAWIEHIETKYPILRSINSFKFDRMQHELQEAVKEKLKVSKEIALLRARERTYDRIEFNRLNNMITYRDLAHQVTKKRQIWPIRKVIHQFEKEVFDLVPCWMASPEAVSAIFPMEQLFDLVIFDEASQCFSEEGIPAMYRGKQVVITGDRMQLSPFDLYKVRWEEEPDEDSDPSLEVDSLLDLAGKYLMQVQLRGHYRSQSLDLIEFSNQHFYSGNLTLLPDRAILEERNPAIRYIKTNGIWSNQINEKEAFKVVEILEELIKNQPGKSVGIVTFNSRQQGHILDVLEHQSAKKGFDIPGDLFVKNIENVQGDERDIIIFSIAYAPDETGKMNHQFGSLNVQKGENRLNVAITRAKEKVIIVASILPSQLKVDDAKNEGPKLLKSYLEFAQNVSKGDFKPAPKPNKEHRVEWYLKNKIQCMEFGQNVDFEIIEEMPFTDLTVKAGEKYLGLILTDDDLYYQSISIKDKHIYTPFTLSAKKWKFVGIHSRDYWHDKEAVKERLIRFAPVDKS